VRRVDLRPRRAEQLHSQSIDRVRD
jgi:hypothetical protein